VVKEEKKGKENLRKIRIILLMPMILSIGRYAPLPENAWLL